MRMYMNMGHMQFDLFVAGAAQQVIGKMIAHDAQGCQILVESTGQVHGYTWSVIQHICQAP